MLKFDLYSVNFEANMYTASFSATGPVLNAFYDYKGGSVC